MSDTPLTDAAIPPAYNFGEEVGQYVPTEFARELERQLAAAKGETERASEFFHLCVLQAKADKSDALEAEVATLLQDNERAVLQAQDALMQVATLKAELAMTQVDRDFYRAQAGYTD